jgi:regulator of cell morphogenesis and NO signaling
MVDHTPVTRLHHPTMMALRCPQPDRLRAYTARQAENRRIGFSFSERDKRADFVASYPELDALCERIGFGWDYTLADWSRDCGWIMLELARGAQSPPTATGDDLTSASLSELVDHLLRHHHQPLRCELNRVSLLIRHLAGAHPHQRDIQALASGFALLRDSLLVHLLQEELEAFPLCLELEVLRRAPSNDFTAAMAEPLHFMAAGHVETGDDLDRLGQLARRAGLTNDPDAELVIQALAAMEHDLQVHTAIENEILLPAGLFTCELLNARAHAGAFPRHAPPTSMS